MAKNNDNRDSGRHGIRCSICGRGENEVAMLVGGDYGYICNECAELAYDYFKQALKQSNAKSAQSDMKLIKPKEITAFLDNYVIGQDEAKKFGLQDMSLQKLYANLFHQKISKAQRLSNWEASELKDSQQAYAATDAWCCIKLYEELLRLKRDGDYELDEL